MKSGQGKTRDRAEAWGVAEGVARQLEIHGKLETSVAAGRLLSRDPGE